MDLKFYPSKPSGRVCAPPSKSVAHRQLIASALAKEPSVIHGVLQSEDMVATLSCVLTLGAKILMDRDSVCVKPSDFSPLENKVFECKESGSTLRFFLPIALAMGAKNVTFKCSERLVERGVGVYQTAFSGRGISIDVQKDTILVNGKLESGEYTVRGDVSSQYVTGLLVALSLVEGDSTLIVTKPVESRGYIDVTLDVMKKRGIQIEERENVFKIKGGQHFDGGEYTVEGDWSNAAFWLALKAMGEDVEVDNLNRESTQGDKAVESMLCALDEENARIDLSNCPDLAPILFAVSAQKRGATFVGTERLKIKESDRGAVMAQELAKYGVKVIVSDNEVRVLDSDIQKPTQPICGHNDHRIVMANAILLCKTGGVLCGAEAVRKSYPRFFEDMKSLGVKIDEIR